MQFPGDGEIVAITPDGATFVDVEGKAVEHEPVELDWDDEGAEKAGFETFMLKEIFEQPEAIAETIGDRVRHGTLVLEGLGMNDDEIRDSAASSCSPGTAYHACVVGRYVIEEWARVPVEFDIASEWVYRNPVINEHDLVIGITQSGETRDTIEALKLAREKGAWTVAITNMMGSQVTREVDSVLYTRAGLEMGVAVEDIHCAGRAPLPGRACSRRSGRRCPGRDRVHPRPRLQAPAQRPGLPRRGPSDRGDRAPLPRRALLPLPRPAHRPPVALEGALKLKEILHIPTEAYSAGEMKHGPIASSTSRRPSSSSRRTSTSTTRSSRTSRRCGPAARMSSRSRRTATKTSSTTPTTSSTSRRRRRSSRSCLRSSLCSSSRTGSRAPGLNVDQPRNPAKTVTVE